MGVSPLAPVLDALHEVLPRTWSIIITLYGDAVVPRGGALDLAAMLRIFAAMAIDPGAVRTAVSRLAADGWLAGRKVGRVSFYRLAAKGDAVFAAAATRIYRAAPPAWDGVLRLALPPPEAMAEGSRSTLAEAGFGAPLPGLWVAPPGMAPDAVARLAGALVLETSPPREAGRRLAARAWPLARLAAGYERFTAVFQPLAAAMETDGRLAGVEALAARILLIHHYRRVILHDPDLPLALLPADWPGVAARSLCRRLYAHLLPASETWLDHHGRTPEGSLPPPALDLFTRFEGGDRFFQ